MYVIPLFGNNYISFIVNLFITTFEEIVTHLCATATLFLTKP